MKICFKKSDQISSNSINKLTCSEESQITLTGLIHSINTSRQSLITVSQRIKDVSSQALPIIGAILEGNSITSWQLVYIAKGAKRTRLAVDRVKP